MSAVIQNKTIPLPFILTAKIIVVTVLEKKIQDNVIWVHLHNPIQIE